MGKPVVRVEETSYGTRVMVSVNGAEVWIRATPGGRRLQVAIDEGDGAVDVEWSIRRASERVQPVITGPFVQSPSRDYLSRALTPEATAPDMRE